AATSQQQNLSVLTDAQKVKLNMLMDAVKLASTIAEAQNGNLLGSIGSPPFGFTGSGSFTSTSGFSFSGVPGCSIASVLTGSFFGLVGTPLSPQQTSDQMNPSPARIVNHWFDQIDVVRINSFETLHKNPKAESLSGDSRKMMSPGQAGLNHLNVTPGATAA